MLDEKTSLKDAFSISSKYTLKRSPKLWLISFLLIPGTGKKYPYMCFNYLKWVDDYVDNPESKKNCKLDFIERQLNLIDTISNNDEIKELAREEYLLYYLIQYANSTRNFNIISEVKNSVKSIQMDAVRLFKEGIFQSNELKQYLDIVVQPVFNLTYYFLFPALRIIKEKEYLGRFVWNVLIVRDFYEDIESGYINISSEDLEKYNLDKNKLKNNPNLILWMKEKYLEFLKILEDDILIFKTMPLKIKLFWSPIYPFMIYELMKIKENNYKFGGKAKPAFFRNLAAIFRSFILITKFYSKIFTRS